MKTLKLIEKELQNWEGCYLDVNCAKAILKIIESTHISKKKLNNIIKKSEGDFFYIEGMLKEYWNEKK